MIRLNDVVARIAAASGQSTMDPAQFLEEMGRLMGGIGGAFDSSIYGLALLVVALMLVGAIDWVAQRRVLRVERFVVHELVPGLADLHDQLLPNLSMADLMTETRDQLRSLGETVAGLSVGLDGSLSALGDRIRDMMADFNSFETQYVRLNDLLGHMGEASTHLRDTTGALRGAAQRIADPLDAFNKTLVQHIETVADAVAATHAGTEAAERNFARLGEQVAAVQAHTEGVVEHLARVAGRQLDAGADRQQQALDEVRAQTARLHESLARVSDALDKATQVQIAGTLQRLDATVGALDERGPQTLFAWTRQGVRRLFRRSAA
jgi:methyl-accepting chemotaxis protein